jgi:hypothetical protein
MFKYSPSARAENADPDAAMFFGSMDAIEIWLPVLSAAVELNGKYFEIVTTLSNAWLNTVSRQLAEHMTLHQQLGSCTSFQDFWGVYADYFQKATNDYHAEIVRRDGGAFTRTKAELHSHPSAMDGSGNSGRRHGDDNDQAYRLHGKRVCYPTLTGTDAAFA